MSYVNQAQDPRRRAAALGGTIAINGTIALLVLLGLTMTGVREQAPPLKPIVEFTPIPEPKPIPTPKPRPIETSTTPVAPLPPVPISPTSTSTVAPFDPDVQIVDVKPFADPGPTVTPSAIPTPLVQPIAAVPSNDVRRWITSDDYPRRSLVDGNEGLARYRLIVGTNGRVSSCEITTSTGDTLLDQTTCRLLTREARFKPATDGNGAKVLGTYTGSVRWEIPKR